MDGQAICSFCFVEMLSMLIVSRFFEKMMRSPFFDDLAVDKQDFVLDAFGEKHFGVLVKSHVCFGNARL